MSIEGLLASFVIVGVVLWLVIAPLLRREAGADQRVTQLARQRDRAQVYYERVLRNLRDLDEDHALGKLEDVDYAQERELWAQRGVQALRALEQLEAGQMIAPQSADDAEIDRSLDDAVEAAVAAFRHKGASS